MTSPLRSFFQFAPLARKMRQLAEKSPDWKAQISGLCRPALIEYELAKAQRWQGETPALSCLAACLNVVTAPARPVSELNQVDLLQLNAGLLGPDDGVTSFRQRSGPQILEGHLCLEPAVVERALARFFEWIASEAFAEMHPIEQASLCQLRLYEIWPFETYSWLTADLFALRVLYLGTSLLPLFTIEEAVEFQDALSQALGLVTKPLVDLYVRACERTCDQVERQL